MQTQKFKIVSLTIALLIAILDWPYPAEAQQPTKIPRIGFVLGSDGSDPRFEAFRQGLRISVITKGKIS